MAGHKEETDLGRDDQEHTDELHRQKQKAPSFPAATCPQQHPAPPTSPSTPRTGS